MAISPEELKAWARFIYELCGVHLGEDKGYLLESRFGALLREQGCAGFGELLMKARLSPALKARVIEAVTTNETSFFRDQQPFELLRNKLFPDLLAARARAGSAPLRIWSAAASSGQEAWSTLMALAESQGGLARLRVELLGTDISDRVLAQASAARYSRLEVQRGLPPGLAERYFLREGEDWVVRPELRRLASFRKLNLMEPFVFPQPFDLIFCRNVAIYFTEPDKLKLFKGLARCLAPEGALLIGATESLSGLPTDFEAQRWERSTWYRLKSAAKPAPSAPRT